MQMFVGRAILLKKKNFITPTWLKADTDEIVATNWNVDSKWNLLTSKQPAWV